ncbi:MAG: aldo/keto reductase [Anaerolineae bacterium UTCFX2]|jgi:voltage-dependent potassium channel beta subunit|nr:aldo/keto reductase [Anaerolineae bacterium]MCZ7551012.1 aldo/keto reductase [Anaerolineales bacterium]OQY88106.1 MAG: aldo/keto reductase [Anaerolineae bacterium UTCFX2]
MEYRFLGNSGLKISALSLGAWVTYGEQVDEGVAQECMIAAYEQGVNFFDNAESYGSGKAEIVMGNVLKRLGWPRSSLVISTKIFWGGDGPNDTGLSRKHLHEGTNAALKRLQLEYVDLIFCHRPDIHTPVEEVVWTMNQIIQQGKAFYWGTSEWSASAIMQAYGIARREHLIPPLMEQPEYNMFARQRVEGEYTPLYAEIGLGTTIWSPLASGLLTGKYNQGIPQDSRANLKDYTWIKERILSPKGQAKIDKVKQLSAIADQLGCTMAQLALAWCLKNPHVSSVITGASRKSQVAENLQSLAVVEKITPAVVEEIENILQNKPKPEADFRKD